MIGWLILSTPTLDDVGGHIITTGGLIIVALVTAIGAYQTARLQQIGNRVKRTEHAANLAADRAEPTGNGYAARTEGMLRELIAGQRDHTTRLARLERHVLDQENHP